MHDSIQTETTHRGRLITVQVLSFTDGDGRHVRREVVRHPGAVVIVPVLEDGSIVLIRNFRIAIDKRILELPAGTLEQGEEPQQAAARELEEETGYRPGSIRELGSFYTSPGYCDEFIHFFLAEDLTLTEQNLQPGEDIEVCVTSRDEALAMIADGRIHDGKTVAGVLMWQRLISEAE